MAAPYHARSVAGTQPRTPLLNIAPLDRCSIRIALLAGRALVRAEAEVHSVGVEEGGEPQGVPSAEPMRMVYWRKRAKAPAELDPDRDGCGCIWVDVAVPFAGGPAQEAVEIASSAMPLFGFEANLSLISAGARCLYLVPMIVYDREVKGEDERAMACHHALLRELCSAGFAPARTGIESVGVELPPPGDDSEAVLRRLKAALDPAGVLAGGKYGRW